MGEAGLWQLDEGPVILKLLQQAGKAILAYAVIKNKATTFLPSVSPWYPSHRGCACPYQTTAAGPCSRRSIAAPQPFGGY
jgi:hypothetical protein